MDSKDLLAKAIYNWVLFTRHAWGVLQTPYITYRTLAKGDHLLQTLPIFILSIAYFGWSSLVHHGVTGHPLQLTTSFGTLLVGAGATFGLVIFSLWLVGLMFGGVGTIRTLFMPWSYSLLPTIIWFFATSIVTLLIPPPRTTSAPGIFLSFVFLAFSLYLFFWKGVLYYLTLRHGMRLGFWRILAASLVLFSLGVLYALLMYRFGIFRIPFI